MSTVAELQPDPNNTVRIRSYRQSRNGVYHDGIVRAITCVNPEENMYEVTLYRPTYGSETTVYVLGSDEVTGASRNVNDSNVSPSQPATQRSDWSKG